jgi:hypothetical protein
MMNKNALIEELQACNLDTEDNFIDFEDDFSPRKNDTKAGSPSEKKYTNMYLNYLVD